MPKRRRWPTILKTVVVWILSVLMMLAMLAVGGGKLASVDPWPRYFAEWGYPDWFRVVTGVVQLVGAVSLLVPRIAAYGAGLLVAVMLGAVITEVVNEVGFGPVIPSIYLVLLALLFVARWPQAVTKVARAGAE